MGRAGGVVYSAVATAGSQSQPLSPMKGQELEPQGVPTPHEEPVVRPRDRGATLRTATWPAHLDPGARLDVDGPVPRREIPIALWDVVAVGRPPVRLGVFVRADLATCPHRLGAASETPWTTRELFPSVRGDAVGEDGIALARDARVATDLDHQCAAEHCAVGVPERQRRIGNRSPLTRCRVERRSVAVGGDVWQVAVRVGALFHFPAADDENLAPVQKAAASRRGESGPSGTRSQPAGSLPQPAALTATATRKAPARARIRCLRRLTRRGFNARTPRELPRRS